MSCQNSLWSEVLELLTQDTQSYCKYLSFENFLGKEETARGSRRKETRAPTRTGTRAPTKTETS